MNTIKIEIGDTHHVVESEILPPLGMLITVADHLTDDGTIAEFEVTKHEWLLTKDSENDLASFHITVKTKKTKKH